MTNKEIKETLEKQLQLLAERSKEVRGPEELLKLTEAMCIAANQINQQMDLC